MRFFTPFAFLVCLQCDAAQVQSWPAERAGAEFREDSLPGHLHEGGARHEDRPHGVQGPGNHSMLPPSAVHGIKQSKSVNGWL